MPPPASNPGLSVPSLIGSTIGDRYRVDRLLDEGAMGRVYVAEHVHMRKRVALKILRPELTRVPEVMARFEREAMAAAHISHPNVATATDFGKLDDGSVYLALEFVEGRTLRVELKQGAIPFQRALGIARQISEALSAAHALSIVHRDLKPENVMLVERDDKKDVVKVLDFGVAKVPMDIAATRPLEPQQGALITKAGMVFGTPDYMAPEQALGQPVDGRADLYSVGVILYEMLAGQRPFKANHDFGILGQQLSGQIAPIAERSPAVEVPRPVEDLVLQLLSNDVGKRVQTAEELAERLARLQGEFASTFGGRLFEVRTEPAPAPERAVTARSASWIGRVWNERARFKVTKLPDWEVVGVVVALAIVGIAVVALLKSLAAPAAQELEASPANPAATEPFARALPPEPSAPTPALEPLTDAKVEQALKAGPLAVEALLQRYPEDGKAHLALARLEAKQRQWSRAVGAARRALELAPNLASDAYLAELLFGAAQHAATKDTALALLQGPMKAAGADVLFTLASAEGVQRDAADAATAWLDTKGFERVSTPAASVAAALLRAGSCRVREALVKRAENVGDRRSAALLREFAAGRGCADDEVQPCNRCLVASKALQAAVAAIHERHPEAAGPRTAPAPN